MPTLLIRRGDTVFARVLVLVLACFWSTTTTTQLVTADETAPPPKVVNNVCQAMTGNCATECVDSTTEVIRTTDDTVHCIHAYTTSKAPTETAAEAPPLTSFGAAVGGIRGAATSNQTQPMDDTNAAAGVVDTVAAALAYDGRGIDYYDPITNIPVTMVWEDIVPCTANEIGQCHHTNYPFAEEVEEEAVAEETEDEAEDEVEEEEVEDDEELATTTPTEDDEELTTTTTPTFAPTAMATTPTVAPTALSTDELSHDAL